MSLLTDKRLMNPENIASGYDLFTGSQRVTFIILAKFTQAVHGSLHVKDSAVMIHAICP